MKARFLFVALALLAAPLMVSGQTQKVTTPNSQLFVEKDSLSYGKFFGRVVNSGYEAPENNRSFAVGLLKGDDTLRVIRLEVPKSAAPDLILSVCFSFNLPTNRSGFRVVVDLYGEIDEEDEGDNVFYLDSSLSIDSKGAQPPFVFRLEQNYPNPFNPTTKIRFNLPVAERVRLTVLNLSGQEVRVLVDARVEAGQRSVTFDATGLASGVYFYRLQAGIFSEVKRMTLIR